MKMMGRLHGERAVFGLFGGGSSKKAPASWRDGPAKPSQKSWAIDLGIDFPPDITKGALSDLIEKKEAARKKRTKGVIGKLKKEVAQLKKEVSGLRQAAKKSTKKNKK